MSINTKLKHYKTVVQPEITYGSETLFKLRQKDNVDKILKIERRIVRTCINKKYQIEGVCRIIPNAAVYQEIEPITDFIRKKRISFFGHLVRTPEDRLIRKILEKLWKQKQQPVWIKEIKEDMKELDITLEDLKNKSNKVNKLKNSKIRFLPKIDKRETTKRVFSEEERKQRSDRMKKYWKNRKEKKHKTS